MFKKMLFAIAPMMLLACSVHADDDLLTAIAKMDSGNDGSVRLASGDDKLGQADVDDLLGDGDSKSDDAIAACYRRFSGHRGYGNRYGSYGASRNYGGYRGYSYSSCYPTYNACYTPVYTYHSPSYSCYTPCYTSYWGCY